MRKINSAPLLPLVVCLMLSGCTREESVNAFDNPAHETQATSETESTSQAISILSDDAITKIESENSYENASVLSSVPIYYKQDFKDLTIKDGNNTIADKGDLIVCLSMIEAYFTDINTINPQNVLSEFDEYIYSSGAVDEGIYSALANICDCKVEKVTYSPSDIMSYIHAMQAVVLVKINHPSIYSDTSTYLLLTGLDNSSSEDACFIIRDPNKDNIEALSSGYNESGEPLYRITDVTETLSDNAQAYVFY